MKFKCLLSGCITEFLNEYDIEQMLRHTQYEVVEEQKVVKPIVKD